jgi:ribose transport system permease protein
MQQASINVVLAARMTFVILTSGIDLSVGSILAFAAMVAVIASKLPGWGSSAFVLDRREAWAAG